jgi:hypothetical protein
LTAWLVARLVYPQNGQSHAEAGKDHRLAAKAGSWFYAGLSTVNVGASVDAWSISKRVQPAGASGARLNKLKESVGMKLWPYVVGEWSPSAAAGGFKTENPSIPTDT